MSEGCRIVSVDSLDTRYEPRPWAFAEENRERIAAHWQAVVARKPAMFNGKVLLMHRWALEGGVFRGAYLMTDYAAFLAWRDFGHPGAPHWNGFSMAALASAEGYFLLGEMGAHTANGGMIYFAAGTPDPSDLAGDRVDLAASVVRELGEETGLSPDAVTEDPGWTVIIDGPRIAFMKTMRSHLPAADLKRSIEAYLASETEPELARMHIVASPADIRPDRMPAFQCAYLAHELAGRS